MAHPEPIRGQMPIRPSYPEDCADGGPQGQCHVRQRDADGAAAYAYDPAPGGVQTCRRLEDRRVGRCVPPVYVHGLEYVAIGHDNQLHLVNFETGQRIQATDGGHPRYEAALSAGHAVWVDHQRKIELHDQDSNHLQFLRRHLRPIPRHRQKETHHGSPGPANGPGNLRRLAGLDGPAGRPDSTSSTSTSTPTTREPALTTTSPDR